MLLLSGDGLNYFWTALSRRLTATRNGRPIVPPSTRINNVVRRTRPTLLITLYTGVLYRYVSTKLHTSWPSSSSLLSSSMIPASSSKFLRKGKEGFVIFFFQESNAPLLLVELISRGPMALGLIARANEQRARYAGG